MTRAQELRIRKDAVVLQMERILNTAAGRDLTAQEAARFEELKAEAEIYCQAIRKVERDEEVQWRDAEVAALKR